MSNTVSWEDYQKVVGEHLGLDKSEIKKETDIYKDLGMDSLGVVSLGMKLHAIFKVKVPMSAIAEMYSLNDMYRILNQYATS